MKFKKCQKNLIKRLAILGVSTWLVYKAGFWVGSHKEAEKVYFQDLNNDFITDVIVEDKNGERQAFIGQATERGACYIKLDDLKDKYDAEIKNKQMQVQEGLLKKLGLIVMDIDASQYRIIRNQLLEEAQATIDSLEIQRQLYNSNLDSLLEQR